MRRVIPALWIYFEDQWMNSEVSRCSWYLAGTQHSYHYYEREERNYWDVTHLLCNVIKFEWSIIVHVLIYWLIHQSFCCCFFAYAAAVEEGTPQHLPSHCAEQNTASVTLSVIQNSNQCPISFTRLINIFFICCDTRGGRLQQIISV